MATGYRIPIGVLAPAAMLVLAALLWTYVWQSAASRAGAAMVMWRADMAARGVTLTCRAESGGGYPFRLEHECTDPVLKIPAGQSSIVISSARALAVAQAWDLDHVIIEIDAPILVARAETPADRFAAAESGVVRASVELTDGQATRFSVTLPTYVAAVKGAADPARLTVESSEVHVRWRPEDRAVDLAVKSGPAALAGTPTGPVAVARFDLLAVLDRPPPLRLEALTGWLGEWRDAGGVANIRRLGFVSDTLAGDATGSVNLLASGHLDGSLAARFSRLEQFVSELEARGIVSGNEGRLMQGAAGLLSGVGGEGPSVSLPVQIRRGVIFLGPAKVAALPPIS